MTIYEIKKVIIDRILDNEEILSILTIESHGFIDMSKLRNNMVFNYLIFLYGSDFISVDASEKESKITKGEYTFSVIINFGLSNIHMNYKDDKNKLDALSELIKGIILDLYPDAKKYRDVVNIKEACIINDYPSDLLPTLQSTTRCITFEVHKN